MKLPDGWKIADGWHVEEGHRFKGSEGEPALRLVNGGGMAVTIGDEQMLFVAEHVGAVIPPADVDPFAEEP